MCGAVFIRCTNMNCFRQNSKIEKKIYQQYWWQNKIAKRTPNLLNTNIDFTSLLHRSWNFIIWSFVSYPSHLCPNYWLKFCFVVSLLVFLSFRYEAIIFWCQPNMNFFLFSFIVVFLMKKLLVYEYVHEFRELKTKAMNWVF